MQVRNILLALVALIFALSVSFFGQEASRAPAPEVLPPATLEKTATPAPAASSSPELETPTRAPVAKPATTTLDALAPNAKPVPPAKPAATTTPPAAIAPEETAPPMPVTELDSTVGLLQGTLVNILCVSNDPSVHSISGTGVFIDSRGLILTAAHVAQFLLLTDYTDTKGSCVARAGSPAKDAFTVKLAYISPEWVHANPKTLTETEPTGTGEFDYAVLAVTGGINGHTLANQHAVSLSDEVPEAQENVSIGSYGAEFLSNTQVKNSLYPIIDFGTVKNRYTFGNNTVDLIALGGSAAAQEGSSGGEVLNADNKLIGLITTSSTVGTVQERNLRAITARYIEHSFLEETGEDFDTYFSSHSPSQLVMLFIPQADSLAAFLLKAISSI